MIVAYDIEVLTNLFTATFVDIKTGVASSFVIHKSRNDLDAMIEYLKGVEGMIGFNNIDFDYAVMHPLISGDLKDEPEKMAKKLYKRAQKIIGEGWRKDYKYPLIPQRDLYRIWHFNNKARATSLKYLQINMNWPDVQDMPIKHSEKVTTDEQIDIVLKYNLNDVLTTIEFYKLSHDKIKMRRSLSEKYGTDFGNFSDAKIGEEIFLIELSRRTGRGRQALMSRRTVRHNIYIKDVLLPVTFRSDEFNSVLETFKGMVIQNTRKAQDIMVKFDGVKYQFGFGGIHALRDSGVYDNIVSADVASYYPNLAISYRFYPEHLGSSFCDVYENLYKERQKYPKGSAENAGLKLSLNGVYGMSNAEWSPFYDPQYTMAITMNGQLLLAKLCEDITLSGAGAVIMVNTDGVEVDVRDKDMFYKVCDEWQRTTKLQLEYEEYDKIAIRDVNNYIAVTARGKVKEKGDYVCDREIFKDQSMKIVTKAVREYYINGTPVDRTINECRSIAEFMIGKRAKTGRMEYVTNDSSVPMPKNIRYYIGNEGGSLAKVLTSNGKERRVRLHKGYQQILFNKWVEKPFEEYNLNKDFYVREANKLINSVLKTQTELFV